MKKPEFVPGDVILEVKSNAHLHKIILRKDTLELIMGSNSFIFDLDKIQSIESDKGRAPLLPLDFLRETPAEIRIAGQSRGVLGSDIWHVLFQHTQNDEINKFVDTFYETQKSFLQRKVDRKDREEKERLTRKKQQQIDRAKERERALDYDSAIGIWEDLGEINEAARVRKLKAEQGAVKVSQNVQGDQISAQNVVYGDQIKAQKVVQGDEITRTDIRDSVVSRSNVGAGSSKMQELKELAAMKEKGIISYAEFRQMKKEILGK